MIVVHYTLTNESEGHTFSEWDEPLLEQGLGVRELFRDLQKQFGRCRSKVYHDGAEGPIGWYFEKRQRYDDANETYLQGAWVTVHEIIPRRPVPVRELL